MVRITPSPINATVNTNIPPPTPPPIQILHFSVKYNWLEISSMNEANFLTRPSKVDSGSQLMFFFYQTSVCARKTNATSTSLTPRSFKHLFECPHSFINTSSTIHTHTELSAAVHWSPGRQTRHRQSQILVGLSFKELLLTFFFSILFVFE